MDKTGFKESLKFNNPFASKRCPKCNCRYQAGKTACPKCNEADADTSRAIPFDEKRMMDPIRELIVFLFGWQGFQLIALLLQILIYAFGDSFPPEFLEANYLLLLNYGAYTILVIGIVAISWKYLPKLFGTLFKKEALYGLLIWLVIFIFDIAWGSISSLLETSTNINQTTVNTVIKSSPILAILFTGIIAPFCEEMTYRAGMFMFTKRINRIVAYVTASIIFGLIHLHDFTSLNEWLSLPPYVFAGLAFAFAYERWGLGASLVGHVANNTFAVILTVL